MAFMFGPDLEWQRQAACAKAPEPEKFFPTGRPSNDSKRACASCDVRERCLAFAIENELQGIWGGMTDNERAKLRTRAA